MALHSVTEAGAMYRFSGGCAVVSVLAPKAFARKAKASSAGAAQWPSTIRFLLGAISVLALAGCSLAERTISCEEDRRCLRYAISADIPVLDPHMSDLPEAGMIFRQIYDTLVYRDSESHQFLPGLALDWQTSQDGLVYTFHLRRDAAFHDGSAFTAAAIAQNIERIFHPDSGASLAKELLGPLQQYEILDEYTIRLRLFEPHAGLLDGLAQPFLGIASPEALQHYDGLRYQYHQSGTGPFMLDDYLPGERIVLRRFDGYIVDPPIYAPLTGEEIDRIEISIIDANDANPLSLLGISQDVIDDVSPAAAQILAGNSRVMLLPIEIPGQTVQFVFNTNRRHLSDRDVRLALLLATNRIAINDQVFFNTSPVAWAPLSESTGYAHTGFMDKFEFDLVQARALLIAAGFADSNGDGILDRAGHELALTILVPPWGQLPEVAALLKEQWRQIGIDLRVEPAPGKSQLSALIQSGEYDLLPVDNHGIDPGILGRISRNGSHYSGASAQYPVLNDMLVRAGRELDPSLRRNLYYEIQALLMKEVLLLPIREYVRLRAVSANVVALRFDAYGFYPLLSNVAITAN